MKVIESLCKVLAHTVLVSHPGVDWEEGDVLQVNGSLLALEEDPEGCLGVCNRGGEHNFIFLPLGRTDVHSLLYICLALAHICPVDEFNADCRVSSVRNPGPYAEAVLGAFFKSYPKEAVVLKSGVLVRVPGVAQAYVMRVLVKRAVLTDLYVSKGSPTLQGVYREFK